MEFNPDFNAGNPLGFGMSPLIDLDLLRPTDAGLSSHAGAATENWHQGKRQPAGLAYDLSNTSVFTDTVVRNVTVDPSSKTANGMVLVDGHRYDAKKEVIVCCGTYKTPQLLMLSGIGPTAELTKHGIDVISDLPVGENLYDKCNTTLYSQLRNPEKGLAVSYHLSMEHRLRFVERDKVADNRRWVRLHCISLNS